MIIEETHRWVEENSSTLSSRNVIIRSNLTSVSWITQELILIVQQAFEEGN